MASKNKKKKLKNSHAIGSWLKNRSIKLKGCGFFTPSNRQENKKIKDDD
jgi:hypothetical protein